MGLWSTVRSTASSTLSRVSSGDYWSDVGHDFQSIAGAVANAPTAAIRNLVSEPVAELRAPIRDLGQMPLDLTAGLPGTGANLGMATGNLGHYGLAGIGSGLGLGLNSAVGGLGSGLGSGLADVGQGLSKPLLYAVLGVVVLLVVLSFATRGRSISANASGVALR